MLAAEYLSQRKPPVITADAASDAAVHSDVTAAMLEPLPYHDDPDTGRATYLDDERKLIRAVAVASALGNTSAHTWLKVPATANVERVLAALE